MKMYHNQSQSSHCIGVCVCDSLTEIMMMKHGIMMTYVKEIDMQHGAGIKIKMMNYLQETVMQREASIKIKITKQGVMTTYRKEIAI